VVLASLSSLHVEVLRAVSVACAVALLAVALFFFVALGGVWAGPPGAPLDAQQLIGVDILSSLLLPMAAGLWLVTVAVTPRSRLDRAGIRRTAIATALTMISFLTRNPALLALMWVASVVVFVAALSAPEHRRARRVALLYLGGSAIAFVMGVLLLSLCAAGTAAARAGLGLIIVAALVRKGIFPFHAWLPEAFDRGRLGPAVLFSAPQLGTYVTLVLIVPQSSAAALSLIATLALVTAVYGAALALFQRDARRSCGYLFVSQSALVMAGLERTSTIALAGSLVLWISSAVAFTGIARCVLSLEARRGRLDLSQHHGGYAQMPLLAVSFLILGLACTGFPGTLGFIGEELLVDGATQARPILGFSVVAAGALTGVAVLRMYFSLFCGRREPSAPLHVRRREAVAFALIAVFLIGTGIAPGPIVASRIGASEAVLAQPTR
jgi:NADH-quinone oxidoreductase subunit M